MSDVEQLSSYETSLRWLTGGRRVRERVRAPTLGQRLIRATATWLVAATVAVALAACGGGESTKAAALTPDAVSSALQLQLRSLLAAAATPSQSANQLMDYAESTYPSFFPTHQGSETLAPFLFRHYPQTDIYLGVAVSGGSQYEVNGVYVMGGRFGNAPAYVGPLTNYISTAAPVLPVSETSSLGRIDVSGVPGIDPAKATYQLSIGAQVTSLATDEPKSLRVVAPLVPQKVSGIFSVTQDGLVLYRGNLMVSPIVVAPTAQPTEAFLQDTLARLNDTIAVGTSRYPADPDLQTLVRIRTIVESNLKVVQSLRAGHTASVKDDAGNDVILGSDALASMDQLFTYASSQYAAVLASTTTTKVARAKRNYLANFASLFFPSAHADQQITAWASAEQYMAYLNVGTTVLGTAAAAAGVIGAAAGFSVPFLVVGSIYGVAVIANGVAAVAKEWYAPSSGFPTDDDWEAVRENTIGLFLAKAELAKPLFAGIDKLVGVVGVPLSSFEKVAYSGGAAFMDIALDKLTKKLVTRIVGSVCPDALPPLVNPATGIGSCPCFALAGQTPVCQR
jgi:hypothetical protein